MTGHVIIGTLKDCYADVVECRAIWADANERHSIKAFPQVTVAPSVRAGYQVS